MKFLYISLAVLAAAFALVIFSTTRRPEIIRVVPKIASELYPGSPRPQGVYCDRILAEHASYQYCLYKDTTYITMEDNVITSTYVFLSNERRLSAGQFINELGRPTGAYVRPGITIMRWQNFVAGVSTKSGFSPATEIIFIGWTGSDTSTQYTEWRGFRH